MGKLLEIDYEKIFSPKTMNALKGKSGESLRQMLGNKNMMQAMTKSRQLLGEIIQAEEGYRDELEMVAAQIVTDAYPIIDYANIRIDGKIVGMGDMNIQEPPPQDDPASPDFGEGDPEKLKAKRRIINGITQGASIRGAFGFMLFREYLDQINPELVQKYNEILKLSFGVYDDPNAIAMMLAALAQRGGQGGQMQGGESEMEYDDVEEQFVIKAKAICFPVLVHEIVKGLYEIVGTEGFGQDEEKNQAIISAVDKVSNEPNDLRFGKFFYDAISKLYNESDIEDARVRELFFAEVYKLGEDEFISFVENTINNELTPSQKQWATNTMKDLEKDLKKDDTGLEDLDEKLDLAAATPPGKKGVIKCLKFEAKRYYANSSEGKLIAKIAADIQNLDDREVEQYLKSMYHDRSLGFKARFFVADLRDAFEGKKECFSLDEGIDDPVKPGILKNRLGKLSCSRVRSAKSKLKDKGTHYAKALQRYLNYHC